MITKKFTFYCHTCKKEVTINSEYNNVEENYDFFTEKYTCRSMCLKCGGVLFSMRVMKNYDSCNKERY